MKKLMACVVAGMLVPAMAAAKATERQFTGTLNLNTATQAELDMLPGVGPKTAKLIIEYRAQKPFSKTDDVRKVKGVGRAIFAKIKDHVSVHDATTPAVVAAKPQSAATAKPAGAKARPVQASKALPRR